MVEEPPPVTSIKARISALNLEQVNNKNGAPSLVNGASGKPRPPPPPPPASHRPAVTRNQSINVPPLQSHDISSTRSIGNQPTEKMHEEPIAAPQVAVRPSLPPRPSQGGAKSPPSLPPRRPSEMSLKSRPSSESISSVVSGKSGISTTSSILSRRSSSQTATTNEPRVRAPPFDPSKLPPLPPKRNTEEVEKRATPLRPSRSTTNVPVTREAVREIKAPLQILPARPALPYRNTEDEEKAPALPSRPPRNNDDKQPKPALPSRNTGNDEITPQQPALPRRSALSFAMNKDTEGPPPVPPSRPGANGTGSPPPIPMSSRPDLAQLQASKPKLTASTECFVCRDFSGPDAHAARFPRQALPSQDLNWLAHQLTDPFPSASDKARAIFTWLHHNIAYDVVSFFAKNVQKATPASTLASGLAVCEGYAGLFAALATHAGLSALVISGHGKGASHAPLPAGAPVPAYFSTHAWNVVQIDAGAWKLIDPCWGAGTVDKSTQSYTKRFNPAHFTMDNNEFGLRHFPTDRSHFYRTDGRPAPTWEEYMLDDAGAERVTVYGAADTEHGLARRSFHPRDKHIRVRDAAATLTVRFHFAKLCPHWDNARHGAGPMCVMLLHVGGVDGRKADYIPFESDGRVWWVDVPRAELGAPGQKVSVYAVTEINGRDARGVQMGEYLSKKGRVGMQFGGVAAWQLV